MEPRQQASTQYRTSSDPRLRYPNPARPKTTLGFTDPAHEFSRQPNGQTAEGRESDTQWSKARVRDKSFGRISSRNPTFMTPAKRIQSSQEKRMGYGDTVRPENMDAVYGEMRSDNPVRGYGERRADNVAPGYGEAGRSRFLKSASLGNLGDGNAGLANTEFKTRDNGRECSMIVSRRSFGTLNEPLNEFATEFNPLHGSSSLRGARVLSARSNMRSDRPEYGRESARYPATWESVPTVSNVRSNTGGLPLSSFRDTVPASILELSESSPQVMALLSTIEAVDNKFERQGQELFEMQGAARQIQIDTEMLSTRLKQFDSTMRQQRQTIESVKSIYR